jgi:quercetin 2,3-dioxygenase
MKPIAHFVQAHQAPVGTFSVLRALPDRARKSVGPWVFLDHFGPMKVKAGVDGVGPHPHAGIETVTYLFSGRQEHLDSAGHRGIVGAGGAQWMTSGKGIVHAEYPRPETEADFSLHGLQLWTTLPRALKHMAPRYQRIDAADIPEIVENGATVRVVAGEYASEKGNARGPADVLMPTLLWQVDVAAGGTFSAEVPAGFEVAAYIVEGFARLSDGLQRVGAGALAIYTDDSKDEVVIQNVGATVLRLMLLGGAPAEGPLVFHGPFVMNSVEDIRAAEMRYHAGEMGTVTVPS